MRPLLIDLYCGEGGAAWGYYLAGWDVIGVDDKPQRRYPFRCFQANVLALPAWFLALAAALHASPPCQGLTEMNNDKSKHLNLIPETRELLESTGKPYTIENVPGARAHLHDPVSLMGQMFDMHIVTSKRTRFDLERERLFETNWPLQPPWNPGRSCPVANVFGGHLRARSGDYRTGKGTGRTVDFPSEDRPSLAKCLMEMPWATMAGMSEAVPPPYTEYIGAQLLKHMRIAA